jgi:hypothetical protein
VHKVTENSVCFMEPEAVAKYLEEIDFRTMVSFPVNKKETAFLMAVDKRDDRQFTVTLLYNSG